METVPGEPTRMAFSTHRDTRGSSGHCTMFIYLPELGHFSLGLCQSTVGTSARPSTGDAFQIHQIITLLWNCGCTEGIGSNTTAEIFPSFK